MEQIPDSKEKVPQQSKSVQIREKWFGQKKISVEENGGKSQSAGDVTSSYDKECQQKSNGLWTNISVDAEKKWLGTVKELLITSAVCKWYAARPLWNVGYFLQ